MNNKTSYTEGTVTLGGNLSFEQMAKVEKVFKDAALDAATSGNAGELEEIQDIAFILGVDSEPSIEDAQTDLHEVA
jgi:hypothetical protein